ncbi:type VI secretion system accessory protein TagJ [Caulobacter segnis]
MNADDLLRAGDLDGARQALVDRVKRAPDDQQARMFLFQFFCVIGEWDKAQTQLKALTQLSPEAQMLAVAYNIAIKAELEREDAFAGRTPPALLVGGEVWAGDLAAALGAATQGRDDDARAARERAFDAAPDTPGHFNDQPFDWIADADPRFGPTFEAFVHGRWGLIPFDAVRQITSEGPEDLRDLVWLPVEIEFKTGQSAGALLPARYPGTTHADSANLLLSRATDWRETPLGDQGVGQKLWSLGDGDEVGILALRRLVFT